MSEGLRTWGLRLLALGIAVGLWFNSSFEDREAQSERVVPASISYSWPQDYIVLNRDQTVNVRVRGSSKRVRALDPDQVDVQVEVLEPQQGPVTITLTSDDVLVPEGLDVVAIEPNVITVEVDRQTSRRIRVEPEVMGEPAAGATAGEPEVFPSQVLVAGPESLVSRTEVLRTRPVSLAGQSVTFEADVAVLPPDPLIQIVQPTSVTVRVPIQPAKPRNGARPAQEGP